MWRRNVYITNRIGVQLCMLFVRLSIFMKLMCPLLLFSLLCVLLWRVLLFLLST